MLLVVMVLLAGSIKPCEGADYLYAAMQPEDYFPVQEYQGDNEENPIFLTDRSSANRVVEFYAPWCP